MIVYHVMCVLPDSQSYSQQNTPLIWSSALFSPAFTPHTTVPTVLLLVLLCMLFVPCVVSETLTASCPLKELTPIMLWEVVLPSDGIWLWFLGTLQRASAISAALFRMISYTHRKVIYVMYSHHSLQTFHFLTTICNKCLARTFQTFKHYCVFLLLVQKYKQTPFVAQSVLSVLNKYSS